MRLIEGALRVLLGPIVAVIMTWMLAAVATFVLRKILDVTMSLCVRQQQPRQGLALSQHGEEGYIFIGHGSTLQK